MLKWLGQYGGYVLIAAGWLLLSGLIPSAAGPADASREAVAVAPAVAGQPAATTPRLIASPRQDPYRHLTGRTASPTPTLEPAPVPTLEPTPEPMPGPTAEPSPAPLPVETTDRIVIPRLGIDAKIVDVGVLPSGEMETAAFAAGRLAPSAQAGEPGNTVISGHNDVYGEVFRRLPQLRSGDDVILFRGEMAFRYRVELRTIVREEGATIAQRRENARWMEPTDNATSTLISCYPYRVDTHRVIVRAKLVD